MQQQQEESARQAGSAMMRKAAAAHITHLSPAALPLFAYVMGHVNFDGTTETPMLCYLQTIRY